MLDFVSKNSHDFLSWIRRFGCQSVCYLSKISRNLCVCDLRATTARARKSSNTQFGKVSSFSNLLLLLLFRFNVRKI